MRAMITSILSLIWMIPIFAGTSVLSAKKPDFSKSIFCVNQDELSNLPKSLESNPAVSRIVISKRQKRLYLMTVKKEIVFEAPVAFGFGFPNGPKAFEGDGKTPEGVYFIDRKTEETSYFRALSISYPNKYDVEYAKKFKRKPGGLILIHGFPTIAIGDLTPEYVESVHPEIDWTQGCIAMTNDQIKLVFDLVNTKTQVEICTL